MTTILATTSLEAAAYMRSSGKRETNLRLVVRMVVRHPGSTASELADYAELGPVEIRRRLVDAERAGLVTKGAPRKSRGRVVREFTWWACERQEELPW